MVDIFGVAILGIWIGAQLIHYLYTFFYELMYRDFDFSIFEVNVGGTTYVDVNSMSRRLVTLYVKKHRPPKV
jgi:hypothetical protein